MDPLYIENGSFYLNKYDLFLKNTKNNDTNRNDDVSKGVVLDEIESMQIDNEQELEIIDFISKKFNYKWIHDIFQDKKIKCIY